MCFKTWISCEDICTFLLRAFSSLYWKPLQKARMRGIKYANMLRGKMRLLKPANLYTDRCRCLRISRVVYVIWYDNKSFSSVYRNMNQPGTQKVHCSSLVSSCIKLRFIFWNSIYILKFSKEEIQNVDLISHSTVLRGVASLNKKAYFSDNEALDKIHKKHNCDFIQCNQFLQLIFF